MKRDIVTDVNKLHELSADVVDADEVLTDLYDTFDRATMFGLAAPQIGHQLRAIMVAEAVGDGELWHRWINPVIIKKGKKWYTEYESCLSLPGVKLPIRRAWKIRVNFTDIDREHKGRTVTGFFARLIQHEIDHLDGILITDLALIA